MDDRFFDLTVQLNNRPRADWVRMGEDRFISIMSDDNPDFSEEFNELPEDEQFNAWFDLLSQQAEWVKIIREGEPGWVY